MPILLLFFLLRNLSIGRAEIDLGSESELDGLPGENLAARAAGGHHFPGRSGKVGEAQDGGIVGIRVTSATGPP